jgi:hypothetical protein
MKSIDGNRVQLALYDEPSASLDPEAEYGTQTKRFLELEPG